ncbi:MAG TPA: Vms1/Ankzf1 family peptidyl-tRNA hydrolase [Thermoleophilaceae bacterium]|nr:Vms1/Ankzf1 family peptidyl-tRNA hydrolase [Thermoleophilaceae bacterium]
MPSVAQPDRDAIRRLAEVDPGDGAVLSVYVNLDPTEFATADARSTAITSAVDQATRAIADSGDRRDLSHEAREALRDDVERVREYLESADFDGTQGIAVFAAGGTGLFEALHLPHPVESTVAVDRAAHVAPLASEPEGSWLVVLVNRSSGRLLRGGPGGLREEGKVDDEVHGQHDQGGWSQARYQRSVDEEVRSHLERVAKAIRQRHGRAPFDHLLVGGPEDAYSEFVGMLDHDIRELVAGRVEVDVENTSADQVAEAAAGAMRAHEDEAQAELLGRLREGLGRGERAVAGLDDTLAALNEQRVEALLIDANLSAPGSQCPSCGLVSARTEGACPADETDLDPRPSVLDAAVERALSQDAKVVAVRERPEIESHGGIAAVLRF